MSLLNRSPSLLRLLIASLVLLWLILPARETPIAESVDLPTVTATPYDWLQFNGDSQHSGNNTQETILSASTVGGLRQIFQVSLPAIADGAPTYLHGVSTPSGIRDLLFVTTKAGDVVALDAHDGTVIWSRSHPADGCLINNSGPACYTTSSPAIDPNHQYVYSYGLDGRAHKHQVGDGTEITTGGWPETASLKPFDEKGSSALGIATWNGTAYLYVANGGYPGDNGDYQGHVTTIDLSTGTQKVFNTVCSNRAVHFVEQPGRPDCYPTVQAAIWARPGVIFDPDTNLIYLATGNGTFNPQRYDWGDSVFALNPDGTGRNGNPLDSYTPTDYQTLQDRDWDLGSTAPAVLPVSPTAYPGLPYPHLALQGGKDGILRLLNLDNLSNHDPRGPGNVGGELATLNVPQGGQVLTQPAVWVNRNGITWAFVANDDGISGLKLTVTNGTPGLQVVWQSSVGGSSPLVANGVVYYATKSNTIVALNPLTGRRLWQGTIGGIHWESPIVVNGTLYVADESSHLTAFGLPAASVGPAGSAPTDSNR